jgi:hypothetical protein
MIWITMFLPGLRAADPQSYIKSYKVYSSELAVQAAPHSPEKGFIRLMTVAKKHALVNGEEIF